MDMPFEGDPGAALAAVAFPPSILSGILAMHGALLSPAPPRFWPRPVFAQEPSQPGTPAPAMQRAPSASTPSTADFVKNAAISGLFEIQSSELALRKKVRPDRQFAKHIIQDHGRIAAQLKHIVRADHVNVQIPSKLDDEHQKMLDQLRGESGEQFDKDYDQMQQQGHQQAVSLFQSYAQNGDNPALKRWAAQTLPTLQNHLNMVDKLS